MATHRRLGAAARWRRPWALVVATTLAVVAIAACGGDGDSALDAPTSTSVAPTELAATPTEAVRGTEPPQRPSNPKFFVTGWAVGDGDLCDPDRLQFQGDGGGVVREDVVAEVPPGHPTKPQSFILFYDMRDVPGGGWQLQLFRDGELLDTFTSDVFGEARGFSKCWDSSIVPGADGTPWPDGRYWVEFFIFSQFAGLGEMTLPSE